MPSSSISTMASNVIEVFIETLHGTAFELLVSPADTVVSIKSRISRLEGIPVSQQHLIWQCQELPDDSSLHDCNITDGATLKLVLGMRGGPIITRKASVEERPSLFDVAKYLDAKGEELGLNTPRLRAVRMVVMRDGDQVHLYTLVDGGSRPSTGSLSEDSTKEVSDEDCSSDKMRRHLERHRENQMTKKKVELLQKKLQNCKLKKESHGVDECEEPESKRETDSDLGPGNQEMTPPSAMCPPSLEPVQKSIEPIQPGFRPSAGSSRPVRPVVVVHEDKVGRMLPYLQLSPQTPGSSPRIGPRLWQPKSSTSQPRQPGGARGGALPKRLPDPNMATRVAHRGTAGRGFRGRCQKVLIVTSSMDPALPRCKRDGGTDEMSPPGELGRFYKQVLPPLGRPGRSCLPKDQDVGPSEQDVAPAAPLLEPPLELDAWDCERPKTAPARFVRLSVLRSTIRPAVSTPCSPEKSRESELESEVTSDFPSGLSTGSKVSAEGTLALSRSETMRPEVMQSSSCVVSQRESLGRQAVLLNGREGAEGIRWALGSGASRRSSSVVPLLRRVQSELWRVDKELRRNLSRWVRLAADHEGEDSSVPEPNPNGSTVNNPERQPGDASSSAGARPSPSNDVSWLRVSAPLQQTETVAAENSAGSSEAKEAGQNSEEPSRQQLPPLKSKKKLGKRCSWCNRKTGLASSYVCRCGNNFCATHRYAELHHCSHDYKTEGRHILQRNNPVVKASKLPEI